MSYTPAIHFCTEEQINNLQKLLTGIKTLELKTSFDMTNFAKNEQDRYPLRIDQISNECGTVCCLAGHGPLIGIFPEEYPGSPKDWISYVEGSFSEHQDVFDFLFSDYWVDYMPTKEEALFRLELFIAKGLPEIFNSKEFSVRYKMEKFVAEVNKGLHTLGE